MTAAGSNSPWLPARSFPGDVGNVGDGQPPGNTHYEFWVATGTNAFKVAEFLVSKQFDSKFPCFIETGRAEFPGLHSTRFYDKVLEVALSDGDPNVPDSGRGRPARRRRQAHEEPVAGREPLKAVVGYDAAVTPAVLAISTSRSRNADADPSKMDAEANARRLAVLQTPSSRRTRLLRRW